MDQLSAYTSSSDEEPEIPCCSGAQLGQLLPSSAPIPSTLWSPSTSKPVPSTSWSPSTSKPVPSTSWSPSTSTPTRLMSWTLPPLSASNVVPSTSWFPPTSTPTPSTSWTLPPPTPSTLLPSSASKLVSSPVSTPPTPSTSWTLPPSSASKLVSSTPPPPSTSWTLPPPSASKPVSPPSSTPPTPSTSRTLLPSSTSTPAPSTWTLPPSSAPKPVPSTSPSSTLAPSTQDCKVVEYVGKLHSTSSSVGYISRRKRKVQAPSEIDSQASPSTNFLSSYLPFDTTHSPPGKHTKYGMNVPKYTKGLLVAHTKPVLSLQWHPCHPCLLLSASLDGCVRLWDVAKDRKCVATYNFHSAAVRYVDWVTDTTALSAGYDRTAVYMDIGYAKEIVRLKHSAYVSVVKSHLLDRNLVLTGDHDGELRLWDLRSSKCIKLYKGACGKILDAVFLPKCNAFVASADIVRRNSFSQAMNIWDIDSGITLTHQLYFEPFTCPCLKVQRRREEFLAQSNGNYIVLFSATKPFKMNKRKRFQGHFVSGFDVGLDLNPDESVLCSASSEGKVHFYDYTSTKLIRTLTLTDSATLAVTWNQISPFRLAVSDWNGKIHILQ